MLGRIALGLAVLATATGGVWKTVLSHASELTRTARSAEESYVALRDEGGADLALTRSYCNVMTAIANDQPDPRPRWEQALEAAGIEVGNPLDDAKEKLDASVNLALRHPNWAVTYVKTCVPKV